MKKSTIAVILSASIVVAGAFAALAQNRTTTGPSGNVWVTFSYNESMKPIEISAKPGQQFSISLVSNMTTGYSWKMAAQPNPKLLSSCEAGGVFEAPRQNSNKEPMVGAAGKQSWTFTAKGKGTEILTFNYARPWEKDTPPIKTQKFKISVK